MVQTRINDTAGGTPSMDHTTFFVTDVALVAPAVDTFTRDSATGLIPRPPDLADDLAFIEVATGRRAHGDSRFPVLQ